MGKKWDYDIPSVEIWKEVYRVLKPGGHLLAFFGSRTYHRGVVNIEDAGFEIRDQVMWIYGSGFPKSHNISKQIDKAAGAVPKVIGRRKHPTLKDANKITEHASASHGDNEWNREWDLTEPTTDAAKQWAGWGSSLKPAHEPIVIARKPVEGTIAENVLKHGTGALNIDDCRVNSGIKQATAGKRTINDGKGWGVGQGGDTYIKGTGRTMSTEGRWPANVIHDGSDEVVNLFPETGKSSGGRIGNAGGAGDRITNVPIGVYSKGDPGYGDDGSAARFFYCAKASKADREEGLEGFESKFQAGAEFRPNHMEKALEGSTGNPYGRWDPRKNNHPTVKPTDLMRYLVKLVTPKGGIVLDPFMGSGTTGKACAFENFKFIGIEMDEHYYEIAKARIDHAYKHNRPKGLWRLINSTDV
jgi:DNA modification methylase